jgi:NosR/NirI family nitrous oxide reductase transcriptional regulator
MRWLTRYSRWLHTQWPAGRVEPLPEIDELGRAGLPNVYIVGDLRGIPLLKFAADSGTKAVRQIASVLRRDPRPVSERDLLIIGAGVSGMAAALEARAQGLSFEVLEGSERYATIVNFPKAKPIYTYPSGMTPEGRLQFTANLKEPLLEELIEQTRDIAVTSGRVDRIEAHGDRVALHLSDGSVRRARAVIIAIGRSGNFRKLNVPGENLDKVYNRLHDPKDFAGRKVLVVGGGDSALETAIALVKSGAEVTLSYRQKEFSRAKPENIEQLLELARAAPGRLELLYETAVRQINNDSVSLGTVPTAASQRSLEIPNDVVFAMLGRDAPLDFFRRSKIRIHGEWTAGRVAACAGFVLFSLALYNWKSGGWLSDLFYGRHWFPTALAGSATPGDGSILSILRISAASPSFWYTFAYSSLVVIFGIRRIRRRRMPYVTAQTLTLMAIQVMPLFLLPEIILPWLGAHHAIPGWIADALFPVANYGHGREYWRSYGFILAWPLMVYNVFTSKPLWAWLIISFVQTFVLIPGLIYFWGKGAYCGWICSCGALAETLGDRHREKMPHGPGWNRLNLAGQGILAIAFLMLGLRIVGWLWPGSGIDGWFDRIALHNYKWLVDVGLAGVVGYGLYFWFSGRVWCRFFCPLAALMHIYARFSRFRILAEKKKCISCNVCTSVCHQGIDVMDFANKGLPMADPQCVRCSACVQSCPTGVLSFGQVDREGKVLKEDRLAASPVRQAEKLSESRSR